MLYYAGRFLQAAGLTLPLIGLFLGISQNSEKYSLMYLLGGLVVFGAGTLLLRPFRE